MHIQNIKIHTYVYLGLLDSLIEFGPQHGYFTWCDPSIVNAVQYRMTSSKH